MMQELDLSALDMVPDIGDCWDICDIGEGVVGGGEPLLDDTFVDDSVELFNYNHEIDETSAQVDELEQKLTEVSQFYSSFSKKQPNNSKPNLVGKDKDKEKQVVSINKNKQDAAKREAASVKRMQELIRQFATIMRQITQHKWAWPFMHPVDVKTLGLHDYYEVIEKPMDFSTIKNKMEAKDGDGYKNVQEIYADVTLVFKNAMTYNEEDSDVHVMAKTLQARFEEKWLQLLPKVLDEEDKRKEEEAEASMDMQLAQEIANAKLVRNMSKKLSEVDKHLEQLRDMVLLKCRKMSAEDKMKLASGLGRLSHEDLIKAVDIIAQSNTSSQATDDMVEIDLDAQSESTLWRLKFLVKGAREVEAKSSPTKVNDDKNSKRKKEICDAIAKTAKKRNKKLSSNVEKCA